MSDQLHALCCRREFADNFISSVLLEALRRPGRAYRVLPAVRVGRPLPAVRVGRPLLAVRVGRPLLAVRVALLGQEVQAGLACPRSIRQAPA